MNWGLIIGLGVLIVLCNATMDEIRVHWERMFGKLVKKDTFCYNWMNPDVSWANKYFSTNPLVRFIFSTILVWTTDFWHFLKFILINSALIIFLLLIHEPWFWWRWVVELAVLNIVWGILFELFLGIYGAIGDKIKEN